MRRQEGTTHAFFWDTMIRSILCARKINFFRTIELRVGPAQNMHFGANFRDLVVLIKSYLDVPICNNQPARRPVMKWSHPHVFSLETPIKTIQGMTKFDKNEKFGRAISN